MTDLPKLVRDRIPERIREDDERPVVHVADDEEYERRLREKLVEEAAEYTEDGDPAELADVLAVVDAIREHRGFDAEELADRQAAKAERNGGFEDRLVLERIE